MPARRGRASWPSSLYRFNRRYELAALPRRLLKAAATTLRCREHPAVERRLTAARLPPAQSTGRSTPALSFLDRPLALPGVH